MALAPLASYADRAEHKDLNDNGPRASQKIENNSEFNEAKTTLNNANEVYRQIVEEQKIPSKVLKNAKCIAVFPGLTTAALGVGGTHGSRLQRSNILTFPQKR